MSSFEREVSSFALPPSLVKRLIGCGYRYVSDIDEKMRPIAFAKELGCSNQEALSVLRAVHQQSNVATFRGKSAFDLLHQDTLVAPIVTFNSAIDEMLGGGIPRGKITEFCGVPGVGKTQIGMQLAVDVHIPADLGGAQGRCIYIDTEGSFIPERAREMASALVNHLTELSPGTPIPAVDDILEHIYYFRIHDYIEQIALIHQLPSLVEKDPLIKLIVLDSVAFHFRHDFENMSLRTRLLNSMAQHLLQLASERNIAVVLINQVTTKILEQAVHDFKPSMLVPALGESWGHTVPYRVMLFWEHGKRFAHLYKSPSLAACTVPYQITAEGIRDIEESGE